MEETIQEADYPLFTDFLRSVDVFKHLEGPTLLNLLKKFTIVSIVGGAKLISQGDIGDSLYVVYRGRFQVFLKGTQPQSVAEVGPGEMIGEIALLLEEPRMASVYAVRDSLVLKLRKEDFDRFVRTSPIGAFDIARMCIKRNLVQLTTPPSTNKAEIRTIAVIPAAQNPRFTEFLLTFKNALTERGDALHLSSHYLQTRKRSFSDELDEKLTIWLHDQESQHRFIIYEADPENTAWTRLCLRQADCILLVGQGGHSSDLNAIEKELFAADQPLTKVHFVLLHTTPAIPNHTDRWLQVRSVHSHHHLRLGNSADLHRLIRYVTGHALGLVLCGGGARGLAHIGVLKAIEELKIPIDLSAGTSIGAGYAACPAMELDYQTIMDRTVRYFLPAFNHYDYTFPFVSLLSGRNSSRGLIKVFGQSTLIENLWKNYFCVSTNLSKGNLYIHDQGSLWKAIRTSSSLPGIFPPIISKTGDVLIDGGVLNNMPVDIMRDRVNGGKIITVHFTTRHSQLKSEALGTSASGWKLLLNNYFAREKEATRIPRIGEIIAEAISVGSENHEKAMITAADHCIEIDLDYPGRLNFKTYKTMIEKGYLAAIEQLNHLKISI